MSERETVQCEKCGASVLVIKHEGAKVQVDPTPSSGYAITRDVYGKDEDSIQVPEVFPLHVCSKEDIARKQEAEQEEKAAPEPELDPDKAVYEGYSEDAE